MIGAVCAFLIAALLAQAPQPPRRDAPAAPTPTGTAVVSGIVTTDAEKPVALRRARVTLSNIEIRFNRTIVTDDSGRFTFRNVPAGRFALNAMKEAYVSTSYGARRIGGSGAPLTIVEGAQLTGLSLKLTRGAVITGMVTDVSGQPVPDAQVGALQWAFINGERRLNSGTSGRTDDRGVYRIFGLGPGQYFVNASMTRMSFGSTSDLLLPTDADVDRALQEPASGKQSIGVGRTAGYVPVYHPSVTSVAQATAVDVGAGEERTGVDIQMVMVPSGRVEGTVTYPEGELPRTIQLSMSAASDEGFRGLEGFRASRPEPNGRYQFGGLPPGDYLVTARANLAGGGPDSILWATANVTVTGDVTVSAPLELRRGFKLAGRVTFEGAEKPPADLRGWRVGLTPVVGRNEVSLGVTAAELQADGTFTISGVTPGRFRVQPMAPETRDNDWLPTSVTVNGRNVLDDPIEIHGDIAGVTVGFTDRVPTLGGKLLDAAAGAAPSEYYVVLFPAERALWTPQSPRIRAVRVATDGQYRFRRVLPGAYLVAATLDVEQGEWMDPSFLQRVAAGAVPVTLADGEQKVQDLSAGKR